MGTSVIARDISDRVRAQREIEDGIERRDQFLAMLSHELRNPLGAIVNAARLIQSYESGTLSKPESAAQNNVEHVSDFTADLADEAVVQIKSPGPDALTNASRVIVRQSKQMSRLLDDLLDVSRITLGKIELKKTIFDLRETVNDAVRAIGNAFSDGGIEFTFDNCDEPVIVEGDEARLQQVVVNLLRNAAKYTHSGGSVRLVVLLDRDDVEIRVRDDGVGIEAEMQSKVFDMFVQVSSTIERSQGGIGLGLTLVKAVVTMHGGEIEVYSEGSGRGSEFRVRLPISTQVVPQPQERSAPPRVRRIAVVEDILDAREMLQGILEIMGYEVHVAGNGREGIELIRKVLPDVSLIDIGLPEIDGYEVTRQLRKLPECKDLYLIALTGYGQQSDREAVTNAGFNAHLVKPLDLDQLNLVLANKG